MKAAAAQLDVSQTPMRLRPTRLFALTCAVALGACVRPPAAPSPRSGRPDAVVYRALLVALRENRIGDTMTVIRTTVRIDSRLLPIRERGEAADIAAEWQLALVARSAQRSELTLADLGVPSTLYSEREGMRIANASLGGARMLALSPVAFDSDSSRALVYFERHCGGLCGGASLALMEQSPRGVWRHRRTIALVVR